MAAAKLELVIHPLCPYAHRAVIAAQFKGVPVELIPTNVADPEPWFLELNPLGEVPALRITTADRVHKLTESLNISEYFDSFPGPYLYPRNHEDKVDALTKGLIDVFIKLRVGRFASSFYSVVFSGATAEDLAEFKSSVQELSGFIEGGNYLVHKIIGSDVLTFADVMLFPHVHRLWVHREQIEEEARATDFTQLWAWRERIAANAWAHVPGGTDQRLYNLLVKAKAGGFRGLGLPIEEFDQV